MKWTIKKQIEAKTITQAIRNEKQGVIVDVYREENQEPPVNTYAIGFHVSVDNEEDED